MNKIKPCTQTNHSQGFDVLEAMEIVECDYSSEEGPAVALCHTPRVEQPVTKGSAKGTQGPVGDGRYCS